jgi:hypothetical protein
LWIERLLGLDPLPPPPHVFSLEVPPDGQGIASEAPAVLRYGCFHPGPQGYVFAANHSVELGADLFGPGPLGGPLRDVSALGEQLKSLLNGLEGPVKEASLVLPDRFLRLTFTEAGDLPRKRRDIQDVLRFKLDRLVPFRAEDLRISATEVHPFPDQEEPRRLLLGFALEVLVGQLEQAFAAAGVALGRITNTTLALASSLEHNLGAKDLAALVALHPGAYTVCYFQADEPLLYRYKTLPLVARPPEVVRRDLRLTSGFVAQHFPDRPLSRLYLAAPQEQEEAWIDWLHEELDLVPEPLSFQHFQITRTQVGPTWLETAPLLGAASLEI